MRARLFGASIEPLKPRLNQKIESKKILIHIEVLRNKSTELKRHADENGADSLDYRKYIIIADLLKKMDAQIKLFNDAPILSGQQEINALLVLVRKLEDIVTNTLLAHDDTLSRFRHDNREALKVAVNLTGLIAVGGAFMLSTWGMTIGALISRAFLVNGIDAYNETKVTASHFMINQLKDILGQTITNLTLLVTLDDSSNQELKLSDEENMICPITGELMENPVILALDGYSYEKEAIKKWLLAKRTSPMTRAEMKEEAKVDDVITENRSLKQLIQNHKLFHPKPDDSTVVPDQMPQNVTIQQI